MTLLRHGRYATLGLVLAAVAAPLLAQPLAVIGRIEPGLWAIRTDAGAEREICAADPSRLVQIQHDGLSCTRTIIANSETSATVHYSCPGAGWGRTTIKYSTPRSIAIDTQGIEGKAPFAFTAQARRTADCKPADAAVAAAR